ncbi:sugar transferase [Lacticaseibacillus suihuaensis]
MAERRVFHPQKLNLLTRLIDQADAAPLHLDRERLAGQRLFEAGCRVFDTVAGLAGLIVLAPLSAALALAIKLDDPHGPVLFSQVRVGRGGRTFRMLKFRSMVVGAEAQLPALLTRNEVSGAMFKMAQDPRVTRVGRFIRRTSLDELPQLLNVVTGDMALVGPRPPLLREVAAYTDYDRQRLWVRPGCTGLWQVSGRNSVGFAEMVALDLTYIKHRSWRLNLRIIAATVRVMLARNSAY